MPQTQLFEDPSEWYQTALAPPQVYELRVRLGVIPESDHAQVLVELFDPVTKVQIAGASIPHERVASFNHLLDWAVSKGTEWLQETLEPF